MGLAMQKEAESEKPGEQESIAQSQWGNRKIRKDFFTEINSNGDGKNSFGLQADWAGWAGWLRIRPDSVVSGPKKFM